MAGEGRVDSAEFLALIDRLEELMLRSELDEVEIEAEGTAVVLRSPAAIARTLPGVVSRPEQTGPPAGAPPPEETTGEDGRIHAVLAPLTGLFYSSPSPGAEPYVREGAEVHVGQVIGLIEAMKLFNEIKSDAAGRVARMCVESGALVKAKQPLIEIEPA